METNYVIAWAACSVVNLGIMTVSIKKTEPIGRRWADWSVNIAALGFAIVTGPFYTCFVVGCRLSR